MAKAQTPPPVDMPLSKAYLRQFEGWSTAAPPGISSPASLRKMENLLITRDGGVRVRPALRSVLPENVWMDANYSSTMVGSWETFYLNDGRRAILFGTRLPDKSVAFRAALYNPSTKRFEVKSLTDSQIGFSVPQGTTALNFTRQTKFIKYVQIDNKILALSDNKEEIRIFYVGAEKRARKITKITLPDDNWTGTRKLSVMHPTASWINGAQNVLPTAQTKNSETLISSITNDNTYTYGFFYTFENEVGESMPGQVTYIKAQRGWSQWKFFTPNTDGTQSNSTVSDATGAMDQFVASMSESAYNSAVAQNATKWNLYMFVWSDQDSIPVEGIMVGSKDVGPPAATNRFIQVTAEVKLGAGTMIRPAKSNRVNFSIPSSASQGLVVGDRIVLVNDRDRGGVIKWGSNRIGEFTNFSSSQGGGEKTLTSGNLVLPVTVKLWQNPQAVDTITILCSGVDGRSTSYYMAPADVAGNTAATGGIMSFEETTATPGTVSPYGVEVFNNSLYHPLDTELMKSTTSNYMIHHSSMTDDIANRWIELANKKNIVSAQHDGRLYYLVDNPEGEELQDECMGNEIWVFDSDKEAGSWSRWLVQGVFLSTLEIGGKLYMSLTRPEGLFVFDEYKMTDDTSASGGTIQTPIKWSMETNTQGANKAHDVWAHLQQVNVTLGNFRGSLRYGVKGKDFHGRDFEIAKISTHPIDTEFLVDTCGCQTRVLPFDFNEFMLVKREAREWIFFAESAEDSAGSVLPSFGQLNFVQYTIRPTTVNVGYQQGDIETFEYTRNIGRSGSAIAYNGVPSESADFSRQ